MIVSYDYDTAYNGPARPIAEVFVSSLESEEIAVPLPALIDSGADATMIPLRVLKRLSARKVDQRRMRDASGLSYVVDMYETALRVGGFTVPKVYAVADRQNGEMILGRDVLNYFVVTLNGLAQTTAISD